MFRTVRQIVTIRGYAKRASATKGLALMTIHSSRLHQLRLATALASSLIVLTVPALAAAQDGDQPEEEAKDDQAVLEDGAIVVTANRLRGELLVEQPPVLELNEADIQGIGAGSISELLEAIAPQTGSARGRGGGRPIFLINGVRVASFREFRSYPPEAIAKVEVFPEEVAQRFGFAPDRRVVNFVLKEDYSSREVEMEYEQPGIGGYSRTEQEFTLLKITDGGRINLNLEASDVSLLTEDERDLVQANGSIPNVATDPDPAAFRSLVSDSAQYEATANYAKAFIDSGSSVSLNATFERNESRSLSGLNSVTLTSPDGDSVLRTFGANNPLERRIRSNAYSSAASFEKPLWGFQFTATADGRYTDGRSEIDRRADTSALISSATAGTLAIGGALPDVADAGFDIAQSDLYAASTAATLRGAIAELPAGELSTTFDVGYDWDRIESQDTRTAFDTQLTRGDLSGGVNVTLPIASTRTDVWDDLGSISLNAQAGVNYLSDFGTLTDWTLSLNWRPFDNLSLQATYITREATPGLSELGAPEIITLNVPIFDFQTGDTVLASIISGGNPNLLAETQTDWKFSANWELPFIENTRFTVDYVRNRSDNVTSSFPLLTGDIEAAFPGRVVRDGDGTLLSIDRRPITFAETRAERLVFGLSMRGSFGSARPETEDNSEPSGRGRGEGRGAGNGDRRGPVAGRPAQPDGQQPNGESGQPQAQGEGQAEGQGERQTEGQIEGQSQSRSQGGRGRGSGRGGGVASRVFGGGDGRGRFFVSLTHTLELENEILIAPGVPVLDQLDGDTLSSSGLVRNNTQLEGGMFRGGYGMRVSARYTGPTFIAGSGALGGNPGSNDLFFDDLATVDLRVFADIGEITDTEAGFLKGFRISLRADNIFDGRRRVTDGNGDTPIQFQPFRIDPTGRYLGVDLRKLF